MLESLQTMTLKDPNSEPAAVAEPERKTRSDRLAQHNEKCERIVHYLRHGKHQDGLTKNQQRTVRGQAKNYILDEISKCKKYRYIFNNIESKQ